MIIALVGGTGSGKTTVAKELHYKHFFDSIVAYTTRERRPGEIDCVDYCFVPEDEFADMQYKDEFAEYAYYEDENTYYGTLKKDYMLYQSQPEKGAVVILTPGGVQKVRKMGIDVICVYLYLPESKQIKRALSRYERIEKKDLQSLITRLTRDEGMFSMMDENCDIFVPVALFDSIKEEAAYILGHIHRMRTGAE